MISRAAFSASVLALGVLACQVGRSASDNNKVVTQARYQGEKIVKSNEQWRQELTPEQYHVLREKGTERAFTGAYWDSKKHGTYVCAACGLELFKSETKYQSGTGWPTFYQPATPDGVESHADTSHGMIRTEVTCARCGGHLGHVFDDGPKPTGLRYCINSAALKFKEGETDKKP